eukprot:TRINITY_DN1622_c0_g2_i2.p1 TRINITY_DN1622_c0_g2~~TRINITY_DN1622_c0_g2_i2.p1  ORF type:complete len:1753 (+),score=500.12 TRINITY_DN1622_c0_g2_i2:36814-42072(+)
MQIRNGTIQIKLAVDGRQFDTDMRKAQQTSEAFASQAGRRMGSARKSFEGVAKAAGLTGKEIQELEGRMKRGLAADSASNALDRVARSAGLTEKEIRQLERQMGLTERRMSKLDTIAGAVGKRMLAVGAAYASWQAISGIVGATTQDFAEFESALTDMGKVTDENRAKIEAMAMTMDRALGDPTSLVRGYYQVISAGVSDTVKAQDLLVTAAKASKAAHLDQAETIKAVTKLMAGFAGEIENAEDATDLLFKTEKLGQTSFAELVPIIGDVASMSNMAGASVEEMAGFLAAFTQTAGSTSQAATQLQAVLRGIIKPTETMAEAIKALGYESGRALVDDKGLVNAIRLLAQVAENSGIELGKLFESGEALTGLGPALADNFSRIGNNVDELGDRAGTTGKAFEAWQKDFQAAKDTFDSTIRAFSVEFGAELAPQILDGLNDFSTWTQDNKDDIITTFELIGDSVRGVGEFIGIMVEQVAKLDRRIQQFADNNPEFFGGSITQNELSYLQQKADYDYQQAVKLAQSMGRGNGGMSTAPVGSTMRELRESGMSEAMRIYNEAMGKPLTGASIPGDDDKDGAKAAERAAKELLRIREGLTRDLKQLTLTGYEYKVWALEQEVEEVRKSQGYILASAETRAEVEKQLQERLNLELAALDQERAQSYKDTMAAALEEVRQMVERQAGARRDLAAATGDVSGYYEAELDLLNMQLDALGEAVEYADQRRLIEQQINQTIAERDMDRQALMMEGIAKAAVDNHKQLADAYRNLPSDAFDAFGDAAKDAFSGIIDGSENAVEALQSMAQSFIDALSDMIIDIAMMEIKQAVFGSIMDGPQGATGTGADAAQGGTGILGSIGNLFDENATSSQMFQGGAAALGVAGTMAGAAIGDNTAGNTVSGAASGLLAGAAIGSAVPAIGTVVGAIAGLVVGAIGGLFSSDEKKESTPPPQAVMNAMALSYGGGNVTGGTYTLDSYGRIIPTLPGPGEMGDLQDEVDQTFTDMEENAKVLMLDLDSGWRRTFKFFSGLITQDLSEWANFNMMNEAARHAVGDLSGAIEYFKDASETGADVITRLGESLSMMLDGFGRVGVDLDAMAGVTESVLMDIAASMGEVGESAEETTERLDAFHDQITQLARAQYADLLVSAVGGEENFQDAAELFANRALTALERAMATVEYSETNLRRGLGELEGRLPGFVADMIGDSTDAFWSLYAEAMNHSMPPSMFSWWADLAQDVAALEDAKKALDQIEFEDWQFDKELEYRRLIAEGRAAEAEQIDYLIQKEAELAQARADGMDRADQVALIEVQIAEMERKLAEMTGGAALSPYEDALDKLTNSIRMQISAAQEQASVARSVRSIIDDLLLGDESTLTPSQQFAYSQDQYSGLYQQALGGDAQAGADAASAARDMLRAAQNSITDPTQYDVLFARTISELGVLAPQSYDEIMADQLTAQTDILERMLEAVTQGIPDTDLLSSANELLALVNSENMEGIQEWMSEVMGVQGDNISSGFADLLLAADEALGQQSLLSEAQREMLQHIADQSVPQDQWAGYIELLVTEQAAFQDLLRESIDARAEEVEQLLEEIRKLGQKEGEGEEYIGNIDDWLKQQTNIERYQDLIQKAEARAAQAQQLAMVAGMAGIPAAAIIHIQEYQRIQKEIEDLQNELSYWTNYEPDVQLAAGGVVTGPTMALVGEGRGPEMVLPLDPFTNAMGELKSEVRELRRENLRMQQLIEGNTRASAHANAKTAKSTERQTYLTEAMA